MDGVLAGVVELLGVPDLRGGEFWSAPTNSSAGSGGGEAVAGVGDEESGTNRGRLRGQVLLIGCVGEVGVPAPVVVGEGVVEYPGADLQ